MASKKLQLKILFSFLALVSFLLFAVLVLALFKHSFIQSTVEMDSDAAVNEPLFKTIKIVYFNSLVPYSWEDSEGNAAGVLIDLLDAILGDKMNYTVIHECYPWKRAQEMVLHGDADAFCTVITPERLEYTTPTPKPLITLTTVVTVSPANPKLDAILSIETISDLKPFRISAYRGYGFLNKYPDFDYIFSNDSISAIKMVQSNRADVYIGVSEHISSLIKRTNSQLITFPFKGVPEVDFYFMIGNHYKSSSIHNEFDAALTLIKEEKIYHKIMEKYF